MRPLEEIRNPEEQEPPNWIDRELACGKSPGFTMRNELLPFDLRHFRRTVARNVIQLRLRDSRMQFWGPVEHQPENQPYKTERTSQNKGGPPTPCHGNPGHNQSRKDRADVGSCVENSGRQRPLSAWEPLGNGLYACWKNTCFAETERCTGYNKTEERDSDGVCHRREAPKDHRECVPQTCSETID